MKELKLKKSCIALDDEWDIIVVGGGPAGCTASAAAAREGAKVLLIEGSGALGGMGTSGLVPAWCPFTNKEEIIYKGMAEKVLKECIAGMPHVSATSFDWTPIDAELLKRIYDNLVTSHGVTVLFNTVLADVQCDDNNNVEAIVVANKLGLTAYKAKVYVDTTGDGDLAVWAGAEYEKGGENGEMQPATHCFTLSNVDMYGYSNYPRVKFGPKPWPIEAICKSSKYPEIIDFHACQNIVGPGAVGFNAGHIFGLDSTDPFAVSRALIQGRKIAKEFRDACAEYLPMTYGNCHLSQTAPLLGIRESRRIIGDFYLQYSDLVSFVDFEDEICRNCYFIDVHHQKNEIGTPQEGADNTFHFPAGKSHGIPYRCLTPKGLSNVLVAGRNISTDRISQGSTRVMPVCLCMGEAAGIAATLAASLAVIDVHKVDTDTLRNKLKSYGAYIH